jgi:hypothetical protein
MVCPNECVIKHVVKQESFNLVDFPSFVNGSNMEKRLKFWNHEIVRIESHSTNLNITKASVMCEYLQCGVWSLY